MIDVELRDNISENGDTFADIEIDPIPYGSVDISITGNDIEDSASTPIEIAIYDAPDVNIAITDNSIVDVGSYYYGGSYGGGIDVYLSNAGDDRDPAWWLSLQARPEARIQVGRELVDVKARPASPTESEYLWPGLEAAYPYYPEYRERAAREIPIVILERSA